MSWNLGETGAVQRIQVICLGQRPFPRSENVRLLAVEFRLAKLAWNSFSVLPATLSDARPVADASVYVNLVRVESTEICCAHINLTYNCVVFYYCTTSRCLPTLPSIRQSNLTQPTSSSSRSSTLRQTHQMRMRSTLRTLLKMRRW